MFLANFQTFAQEIVADTTIIENEERSLLNELTSDSAQIIFDSTQLILNDVRIALDTSVNRSGLNAKVEYEAQDSIRFDLINKRVYLYNNAVIDYQEIKLEAADVKIHFEENLLFAEGVLDTLNKLVGKPVFTEGDQVYKSKYMKYNYRTKKAFIREVFTEDGEGFLHGKIIKKLENQNINVSEGSFTTCSNEEHPHFSFFLQNPVETIKNLPYSPYFWRSRYSLH